MRVKGCWKPGLIALGTVTILSSGCARGASDHAACPPVVAYPVAFQARAAAEIEALPAGTVIETMLADYHVMRRQAARTLASFPSSSPLDTGTILMAGSVAVPAGTICFSI